MTLGLEARRQDLRPGKVVLTIYNDLIITGINERNENKEGKMKQSRIPLEF